LDNIIDNLGGHRTLVNDLNRITVGYDKLAIQTTNREKDGSRLATLGGFSTVNEQDIATFSGAG